MFHKLLKAHHSKSHKLTAGPRSFWEGDFQGLWDELSEVSLLAHRMLWWLVSWDSAVPSGPLLAGWRLWHRGGSLVSTADADVAQFRLVNEVSNWMGWCYQRAGSKQDSHLVTGTAWLYVWYPAGVFTALFENNSSCVLPKRRHLHIPFLSIFLCLWERKSYKDYRVPKKCEKSMFGSGTVSIHGIYLRKVPWQVASWWLSHPKGRNFKETKLLSN